MARLNLYEQQTSSNSPRADGYSMGAAPAQALEGAGNALADIGYRVQKREELGLSQHVMENAEEMAQTAITDLEKRQDINTPKAMQDFEQAMQQIRQNGMLQYAGSSEGRAALENRLDNQLAQYRKSAIATRINASHLQMGRALDQQFKKSVMQVDEAPDIWSFAKDENLAAIEMWKPAMSKDQYEQAKRLAHAKPLQAAVQSYLAQKDLDAADALINDPSFSKFLTIEEARPLRIDAAVERGKVQKETRERESNRRAMSTFLGYDVSEEQADAVPDFAKMAGVQKMNVWQMMNPGKVMPDDMKLRALNLDKQETQDKSMRVAENLQNWNNLTPQDKTWTRLELAKTFPPVRVVDPLTNEVTYAPNPSAGYMELNAMGFDPSSNARPLTGGPVVRGSEMRIDSATQSSRDTEARGMIESEIQQAQQRLADATTKGDSVGATRAKGDVEALTRELGRMSSTTPTTGVPTGSPTEDNDLIDLYDNADKLVGVRSGLLRLGEGLPLGIGDKISEETKGIYERTTRSALRLQNDIVDGLRGADEKIANQYREELKKIVTIDPQIINSEYKLRTTFKTIDSELRKKQKDYQKIVDGEVTAGPQEKKGAAYAINAINSVLSRMNVPQKRVNTREEVQKLQPGTRFLYRDDPTPQVRK